MPGIIVTDALNVAPLHATIDAQAALLRQAEEALEMARCALSQARREVFTINAVNAIDSALTAIQGNWPLCAG